MRLISLAITVLLVGSSETALAQAATNNALVERIQIEGNKGFVRFDTVTGGTPAACGLAHNREYSFSLTTNGGKSIFALLTAAKMSQSKVLIRGTQTCTVYPDYEDWNYGFLQ